MLKKSLKDGYSNEKSVETIVIRFSRFEFFVAIYYANNGFKRIHVNYSYNRKLYLKKYLNVCLFVLN
jgi:hypothetical protein